ncbi:MAG TPA: ATP-binding protein [Candidatus Limnocylindrales bacterium]|nr:ATP-binding protein [Candidatus Limnocylindrales bacterium]
MDVALLLILLGSATVALAVVGRRLRDREDQLAEIARSLRTAPTATAILNVVERRARQAADTERRLDETLREREFLGGLLGVGAIHLDDDGRVDVANPVAHTLLDVGAGSLLGRTVMEAFADARVEAIVDEARTNGTAAGEVALATRSGMPRSIVIRASRSPVRGRWVLLEDVTELRSLQRIRTEFVDNLSHELRTPLTTVTLLAETLAREAAEADVPARMRERIGRIEVETGHLVQMVNELLDLSRIESGRSLSLRDDVDLGRVASASTERLRLFADRSEVALHIDVEPGLPRLRGDEDRLAQVFVNLVHNAVKFSDPGGTVTVTVRRDGDRPALLASVADEGIGIPRADRARVFERFYKVDRARVRGGGTGLGLAIARHVVEQHGGRIWVESEEGTGSVFSFSIPLAAAPADGAAADPSLTAVGRGA